MTRKQWKGIIGINLLTILLVLSPFLPGPSLLSRPTNVIFSLAQLGSIFGLLLIPVGLIWTFNQMKKQDKKVFPILLWTVPMFMFVFSIWGSELAREMSRTIAINNAGKLINAIENFRKSKNQYPNDISELKPEFIKSIPTPWIMGISGYNYEKKGDYFNLTFSQNVIIGFNFEVVVYDPTENHKTEGELTTLYETGKDKWKYYIYD
ncbi:MAG: hypothetical protein DCF13_07845 [Flavobacteriaceae bacterium]|nr:MAG: hypothetical protein DCF13_07845 [Flavobacteriaceae bacterium]